MAIVIEADMPKGCSECPMQYVGEERTACFLMNCYNKIFINKRPSWCPIIGEIPYSHGDLIDRGLVQEVLAQLLPLVITNELTDKEIGLVHRTVGAIAEMINEQEVVVEATE